MPSYKNSMTSQIVFVVVVTIVIMQLYYFFMTQQILDLFNTIVSWFVGAYMQRMTNQVPDKKLNEPESENDNGSTAVLEDNTQAQQEELDFISQKLW